MFDLWIYDELIGRINNWKLFQVEVFLRNKTKNRYDKKLYWTFYCIIIWNPEMVKHTLQNDYYNWFQSSSADRVLCKVPIVCCCFFLTNYPDLFLVLSIFIFAIKSTLKTIYIFLLIAKIFCSHVKCSFCWNFKNPAFDSVKVKFVKTYLILSSFEIYSI
jgi:hypothetical protein